jgi:hypothetical protein
MKIINVNDDRYDVIRELPSNSENIDKIKLVYEELYNAISLIHNKATNTTLFCRKIEDGDIDES